MKKSINNRIQSYIKNEGLFFKKHALEKLLERSIRIDDIISTLENGEIIKEYQKDEPLPSYLMLGYTTTREPIHVVMALDDQQRKIWVITVYKPDKDLWDSNFKRRIK